MAKAYLSSYEPISVSKTYKQGWSDTYITIYARPNRRIHYGPTLLSQSSLDRDIEFHQWALEREQERLTTGKDDGLTVKTTDGVEHIFKVDVDPQVMIDHYTEDIARDKAMKERLKTEPIVIQENPKNPGIPNIYTAAEYLDRAEVERLIWAWLRYKGHKVGSLKWKRTKGFVITPVG